MVITFIEKQKKNTDRYNVFVDDTYSFSAGSEDIIKYGIRVNTLLDDEKLQDLIYKCQYSKALDSALNFLSVRLRSAMEVIKKLKSLDYSDYVINLVMSRLTELDYVNDVKYCETWIEERARLRPAGKRKIIEELRNKGIASQVVSDVIEQTSYNELDAALQILNKKMMSAPADGNDIKAYQKLYRYLISKGISFETARKALETYLGRVVD
jgi:regulatory protein